MKANVKPRMNVDDRAESGVGTMIIFIALVLVAAVAAAVLVGTSGMLQERATSTGVEATKSVSSNMQVLRVEGYHDSGAGAITSLNFTFELSAGSLGLNLGDLAIVYNDGESLSEYSYDSTNDDPTSEADASSIDSDKFGLYWVRNADGDTLSSSNPTLEGGDLVRIHFAAANNIDPRTSASVEFVPESGARAIVGFQAPTAYGDETYITLR